MSSSLVHATLCQILPSREREESQWIGLRRGKRRGGLAHSRCGRIAEAHKAHKAHKRWWPQDGGTWMNYPLFSSLLENLNQDGNFSSWGEMDYCGRRGRETVGLAGCLVRILSNSTKSATTLIKSQSTSARDLLVYIRNLFGVSVVGACRRLGTASAPCNATLAIS